jgi:uncharacterized phage infection (PIP) family protein YhgE
MAATKQLRKENEELRNDISELQKKLDKITEEMSKINDKTDQIEGSHVAKDQEKSIQFVSDQYDDLVSFKNNTNTELKYIKSQVEIISTKCDKIAKAVDQLEDYSYQYNLKIVGIPQEQATETAEQTANLCLNLFKSIGANDVILQDIDIAHRIPARRSTDRPNAIICKFVRRLAREKVMSARRGVNHLRPSQLGLPQNSQLNVNIYDHLSPRVQELLYEAKKYQRVNHFQYCWVRNKKTICLRKSETDEIIKLNSLQDLLAL